MKNQLHHLIISWIINIFKAKNSIWPLLSESWNWKHCWTFPIKSLVFKVIMFCFEFPSILMLGITLNPANRSCAYTIDVSLRSFVLTYTSKFFYLYSSENVREHNISKFHTRTQWKRMRLENCIKKKWLFIHLFKPRASVIFPESPVKNGHDNHLYLTIMKFWAYVVICFGEAKWSSSCQATVRLLTSIYCSLVFRGCMNH